MAAIAIAAFQDPSAAPAQAVEIQAAPPFQAAPAAALAARRARLLDSIGEGVVLVRAASERDIERDYAQDSDFRQNNDFLYLTGLETPDSWLLLAVAPDGTRQERLFVPERNPAMERWTGAKPSFEDAAAVSGITEVAATDEVDQWVRRLVFRRGGPATVYVPLNQHTRDDELIQRLVFDWPLEVRDVEPVIAQLRLVKDEFELRMLQRAIDITAAAQRAAMRRAGPGMYEYEIEAVIEYTFRAGGAERVGFPSIVGAGPNSVVLHYDESRRRMQAGDLVVVDIGAEYSYYTADVTRTIPVSGEFDERQRAVYELVLGAQQAGIEAVRPGATIQEVNAAARSYMQSHSGDLCGGESCDRYFVHGIGHWLGMDVHDVGSIGTPFEPGMVLTVEPGIYISEENLGVRIEDDVVVTETGRRVMSADAPRDPDEIEALMKERLTMN
jgi:Xaa-Pro aminopeptidase